MAGYKCEYLAQLGKAIAVIKTHVFGNKACHGFAKRMRVLQMQYSLIWTNIRSFLMLFCEYTQFLKK
jgi:hypothetical protein